MVQWSDKHCGSVNNPGVRGRSSWTLDPTETRFWLLGLYPVTSGSLGEGLTVDGDWDLSLTTQRRPEIFVAEPSRGPRPTPSRIVT